MTGNVKAVAKWLITLALIGGFINMAAKGQEIDWPHLQQLIETQINKNDALVICDPKGNRQVAIHQDDLLIPASILKILTASAAIETLGAAYHFPTEFFLSNHKDLKIKGYGDPIHVSETLQEITATLALKVDCIDNLVLDDSYFAKPIRIPGRGTSFEPYDAPNGALCVNFNTVAFKRNNGRWISAEPQTPLLPVVVKKIQVSGLTEGRITLAGNAAEGLQYTGELYHYFLTKVGVEIKGRIVQGVVDHQNDKLLYRFEAREDLKEVVGKMLAFSNNFIANQLVLAMGAHTFGAPASMEKGLSVLRQFSTQTLGLTDIELVEGSGLSRQNRISANAMMTILSYFQPYHTLMRRSDRQWYKTGTLNGIHTRAGYFETSDGRLYPFVLMINTPGKRTDRVLTLIDNAIF